MAVHQPGRRWTLIASVDMEAELTSCAVWWRLTTVHRRLSAQVTYTAPREPDCIVVGREEKALTPSSGYGGVYCSMEVADMGEGRLRFLVAEARCYWCGSVAGTLEGGWPLIPGTLMFRRSGEHEAPAQARPDSPDFRCGHCGGPLLVDEFDIVMVRSEKLEESDERPRRGRPPKRPR